MAQPKYAKVDPADYKRLKGNEWIAKKGKNSFYALRHVARGKGKNDTLVYIHQEIIQVPEGMVVDHINNDGMDNRSANLRAATKAQNSRNRKKFLKSDGSKQSKYKGVCWHKKARKWIASITSNSKSIYLGIHDNEIDAARAYDEAAKKYHGEFACLNFPE